jgi:hypothetical protein
MFLVTNDGNVELPPTGSSDDAICEAASVHSNLMVRRPEHCVVISGKTLTIITS